MGFGSKTNAPKDGLKIRVMEIAIGPSLFRDVFALNGDPQRQTPFARSASTRFRIIFHGLRARKRRLAARNAGGRDFAVASATTQILNPNFLWKFLHQKPII